MMRFRFVSVLALFVVGGAAQAATILNITGPDPFGFANQIVIAVPWTQTATYSNVSISMPLADLTEGGPIGGVQGTVYLMDHVGPGATAANEVAPPVPISGLTASFTTIPLFSGLTLFQGTYYVVLASTSANSLSMSPEGSSFPVVSSGVGITVLGAGTALTAAPFAPATLLFFNPPPSNMFIDITGDLVSVGVTEVPTLGTVGLAALLLGLAATALLLLSRPGT